MTKLLKGSTFKNRYRITGQLKTLSPLHIGTGEESETRMGKAAQDAPQEEKKPPKKAGGSSVASEFAAFMGITDDEEKKPPKKKDVIPKVSTVIKDAYGKPFIPGSSLRGVMRHWLLHVLRGISPRWAMDLDVTTERTLLDLGQEEQIDKIVDEFSLLQLMFGTSFNAGKIEVWDANCVTQSLDVANSPLKWDKQSLTYVDTSVAIDPNTGTALDRLLYQTEVVPQGVVFDLNIVGQNLSEEEVGLLLLALQGFNSAIYPIRIGARNGRGYGRVEFIPGDIYCLDDGQMSNWIQESIQGLSFEHGNQPGASLTGNAGYFGLPKMDLSRQQALIDAVKTKLSAGLGG